MKRNEELQKDVQEAIKFEPLLNAAEIGVTVKDGVVTLTGVVDTYTKKIEAENAAKSVAGVKVVIEKITIEFARAGVKTDADIANEITHAFTWDWDFSSDKVKIKVEDGWVTLEGELKWNYQKDAAKKTVTGLAGVKGVTNNILVKSYAKDDIEKKDIESALMRNWAINREDIKIDVLGNKVLLSGKVDSLYQKDEVGRIAWNAQGVEQVENDLAVEYN